MASATATVHARRAVNRPPSKAAAAAAVAAAIVATSVRRARVPVSSGAVNGPADMQTAMDRMHPATVM